MSFAMLVWAERMEGGRDFFYNEEGWLWPILKAMGVKGPHKDRENRKHTCTQMSGKGRRALDFQELPRR